MIPAGHPASLSHPRSLRSQKACPPQAKAWKLESDDGCRKVHCIFVHFCVSENFPEKQHLIQCSQNLGLAANQPNKLLRDLPS